MSIYALINKFNAKGINLFVKDGQLKFKAPKGALTNELKDELIANKPEIIAFLQQVSSRSHTSQVQKVNRTTPAGNEIVSFPLSYSQERLWFIDQLEPNSATYNIPKTVLINGDLDIVHLEQAFKLIISRHEVLRTVFTEHQGKAQQVVLGEVDFRLTQIDLSHHNDIITRHEKAKAICLLEAETPFELSKGPLLRAKLIKLKEQQYVLIITLHHIISDGWSTSVMVREFSEILSALSLDKEPNLPILPIQYADYSVWQRKHLDEGGVLEQQLGYWREKLAKLPASLELTTDHPRTREESFQGATAEFAIDERLTEQLKSLSDHCGSTLFMTLLAVFNGLLYRYTGQHDICLGTPIANRQHIETEGLIGMFVNTLALRNQVDGEQGFDA
ncbi:condensation domain-containing protein, partial [Pseudoalteromonas sp. BMB]|uniref:condensation domain-containing protein n=1 Tax=Pseudoalteromonas sp. BMB TaxID=1874619 RepID=UPI000AD26EBF